MFPCKLKNNLILLLYLTHKYLMGSQIPNVLTNTYFKIFNWADYYFYTFVEIYFLILKLLIY